MQNLNKMSITKNILVMLLVKFVIILIILCINIFLVIDMEHIDRDLEYSRSNIERLKQFISEKKVWLNPNSTLEQRISNFILKEFRADNSSPPIKLY